jgi:glyoxylase-like metal-dependent hydrolase (beta-lactamase superfamily II)
MREPLYKTRRIAPAAAQFDTCCARINDFIVMSEGNSNVYLIETPAGGILINSGMGFEAPVHRHNLGKFSDVPIRYLVTTQGHVDHVGGVQYFRDLHPGLVYIAQAGNPEHQEYDARLQAFRSARAAFRFQDDFKAVFERYAAAGYVAINPQDRPTPDVLFGKRHEFSLGGLDVVLLATPGGETFDSLVVWLPESRTLLSGNLTGPLFGHVPNLVTIRGDRYRDALAYIDSLRIVADLAPESLITGHFDPIVGADRILDEIAAMQAAMQWVHDRTVDAA